MLAFMTLSFDGQNYSNSKVQGELGTGRSLKIYFCLVHSLTGPCYKAFLKYIFMNFCKFGRLVKI